MREYSGRDERTGYRLRRAIGGAAGVGAAAVVLIMALSPIAAAGVGHSVAFPGAGWYPTSSKYTSGCAGLTAKNPGFSVKTGFGHWMGKATAKTCPKAKGGVSTSSSSSGFGEMTVMVPVKLTSANAGVSATWNIKATETTSAGHTGALSCPTSFYNFSYNFGYTWYNGTSISQYCSAESGASIGMYGYLIDKTTGTYFYSSNYWPGVYNNSGFYQDTYYYAANYSNSSYWASNYSYSGNYSYNFGSPNGQSGTWIPTLFFNGSFTTGDKFVLTTYLYNSVYADIYQVNHAHASASLNAMTLGNHEDLTSVVKY